ncbi:carbonate dehydratase [Fibrivirga algicola]|uniref:Carbonic anhydrase n=1 Tax=Fibrivirga algicola TaxID=2950420 RepID=A0ABX0QKQ2_9BACT|nr:carbonate dehydratase [Fibrivirga algicola]NID11223.1 carbonate dehydratase [Fibrivirga algicola]
MLAYEKLLLENKAWAQDQLELDDNYFDTLASGQKPKFLWIGCADSRVPAESITGAQPGEIFVHRNVANLVIHTDMNLLSVLQYAVEVLKVEHVIVCGHYGCGGVKAAMTHDNLGLINKWLRNIKDVYARHEPELTGIVNETERVNRLVELNVITQVQHVVQTSIIQSAWHKEQRPTVHGWVFGLQTGLLTELINLDHTHEVESIYRYDFSTTEVPVPQAPVEQEH